MPNPWAAVIVLIGLAAVIIGVKGNEHNLIAAVLGRGYKTSTLQ